MSNIFIGLKKTCLGVLERGDRDKNNETGLKEGGGIEMSTTVLPLRDARSLRFTYRVKFGLAPYRNSNSTVRCLPHFALAINGVNPCME